MAKFLSVFSSFDRVQVVASRIWKQDLLRGSNRNQIGANTTATFS